MSERDDFPRTRLTHPERRLSRDRSDGLDAAVVELCAQCLVGIVTTATHAERVKNTVRPLSASMR
ncbi:MAG TPA: hypothetical protein VEF89_13965 [Solirubrobacteraceae bacterium]|nr:hypothetical protein [Solirubrobacteraceae bacterium]